MPDETRLGTGTAASAADAIIAALRAHETELRQAGVLRLSLFGFVARDEAEAASDVDLCAELDPGRASASSG